MTVSLVIVDCDDVTARDRVRCYNHVIRSRMIGDIFD